MPYEGYEDDYRNAKAKWGVVFEHRESMVADDGRVAEIAHVSAEAGTGSRYAVVVTPLSEEGAAYEGGRSLVTVLQPWQDCWALGDGDVLSERYVAEHLTDGRHWAGRLHGGDLVALTMTIGHALRRRVRP